MSTNSETVEEKKTEQTTPTFTMPAFQMPAMAAGGMGGGGGILSQAQIDDLIKSLTKG